MSTILICLGAQRHTFGFKHWNRHAPVDRWVTHVQYTLDRFYSTSFSCMDKTKCPPQNVSSAVHCKCPVATHQLEDRRRDTVLQKCLFCGNLPAKQVCKILTTNKPQPHHAECWICTPDATVNYCINWQSTCSKQQSNTPARPHARTHSQQHKHVCPYRKVPTRRLRTRARRYKGKTKQFINTCRLMCHCIVGFYPACLSAFRQIFASVCAQVHIFNININLTLSSHNLDIHTLTLAFDLCQ